MSIMCIKSLACFYARQFFAFNNDLSWSVCMKLGWAKSKAMKALSIGCKIKFKKLSTGEITEREAKAITAENYEFKGSDKAVNPYQVKYFDVTANGVRSLNIETLIAVN